jgi:hypothetical protein
MDSTSSDNAIECESYALAIGFGELQKPICLILGEESLEHGGTVAMSATEAKLSGHHLCLSGPQGSLMLMNLAPALREAAHDGLPFVVLNSNTRREHIIANIGQ